MSSVSLPVTRSAGCALLVGAAASRARTAAVLGEMGFTCAEADEPYGAMAELSRRPTAYGAMVLSLQNVYREELHLIATIKRRFPHVEVWLTDTDGRPAGLADAMGLGADGLLGDDGLHRVALAAPQPAAAPAPGTLVPPPPTAAPAAARDESSPDAPARPEPTPVTPPPDALPESAPPARSRGSRRSRGAVEAAAAATRPAEDSADPEGPTCSARAERTQRAEKGGDAGRRTPEPVDDWDGTLGDAVLTAEELRALLHEQPAAPPVAEEE